MNAPVKHDWRQIILDLEAVGIGLYKIGLATGMQYNQVKAIRDDGREPKHFQGELLKRFHAERTNVITQTVQT